MDTNGCSVAAEVQSQRGAVACPRGLRRTSSSISFRSRNRERSDSVVQDRPNVVPTGQLEDARSHESKPDTWLRSSEQATLQVNDLTLIDKDRDRDS